MQGNKLFKGVNYVFENSHNFENETVSINFISPLGKNSATDSLLIHLLSQSCTKYKSKQKLEDALNKTCAGKISSCVSKAGDEVVLSLKLSCIPDTVESFKDGVKILSECLFRPNITPDGFIEENVKNIKKKMLSLKKDANKNSEYYAENKLIQKMCESETFALSVYGTDEQLESVSCKELLDRWLRLMRNCPVQINYIGKFDAAIVQDIFTPLFKVLERKEVWPIRTEFIPTAYEKGEYTEKIKSEQEYVCIGFRAGMSYDRDSCECVMLFTQLYSNLLSKFMTDKNLSDDISVKLYDDKGILTVRCAVKDGKTQPVVEEIRDVLKKIQSGEFLPSKLSAAKSVLTKKLKKISNSAQMLDDFMLSFTKNSEFIALEELISRISEVCIEEVIVSACMIDEDTVIKFLKA